MRSFILRWIQWFTNTDIKGRYGLLSNRFFGCNATVRTKEGIALRDITNGCNGDYRRNADLFLHTRHSSASPQLSQKQKTTGVNKECNNKQNCVQNLWIQYSKPLEKKNLQSQYSFDKRSRILYYLNRAKTNSACFAFISNKNNTTLLNKASKYETMEKIQHLVHILYF